MSQILTSKRYHYQARVSDLAYGLIEHDGQHYEQLVGYYPTGLGPPEIAPKKENQLCLFDNLPLQI